MELGTRFGGKIISIQGSGFKYRLTPVIEIKDGLKRELKELIEELRKSYNHDSSATRPYGQILKDIRELLKKNTKCTTKTAFAKKIGLKSYATVYRWEKRTAKHPEKKTKTYSKVHEIINNLETFYYNELSENPEESKVPAGKEHNQTKTESEDQVLDKKSIVPENTENKQIDTDSEDTTHD